MYKYAFSILQQQQNWQLKLKPLQLKKIILSCNQLNYTINYVIGYISYYEVKLKSHPTNTKASTVVQLCLKAKVWFYVFKRVLDDQIN